MLNAADLVDIFSEVTGNSVCGEYATSEAMEAGLAAIPSVPIRAYMQK